MTETTSSSSGSTASSNVADATVAKTEVIHNGIRTDELERVIFKLLDKVGVEDPRLTPRKLREKAEERLYGKTECAGKLKAQRNVIKDLVMKWVEEQRAKEVETLRALLDVNKAARLGPTMLKNLSETSRTERIIELRKRLREKGLIFSDVPTAEEIAKIEKQTALKKDMDGIDASLIIDKKRKAADPHPHTTNNSKSTIKEEPAVKKIRDASSSSSSSSSSASTTSAASSTTASTASTAVKVKSEETSFKADTFQSEDGLGSASTAAVSSPTVRPKVKIMDEEEEAEF